MYLQNMKDKDLPRGTFHIARWHVNGKLWISEQTVFLSREAAQETLKILNNKPDPGNVRRDPYFTWNYEEWKETEGLEQVSPSRSNRSEPL